MVRETTRSGNPVEITRITGRIFKSLPFFHDPARTQSSLIPVLNPGTSSEPV